MTINNFAASGAAQEIHEQLARAKRAEIESRPGGLPQFVQSIIAEPVVSGVDHVAVAPLARGFRRVMPGIKQRLADFYAVYEKCFPIPGERESHKGFRDILTKGNFDGNMKSKVGNFREFIYTLRDPKTGKPIGGLNFAVYIHPDGPPTMHSTYAFLKAEYRGLGLAKDFFAIRDKVAVDFLGSDPAGRAALEKYRELKTFSEQNIPELMDGASYVKDGSQAIDQVKRLQIWNKLGYSCLKYPYVQPPLEDGGESCDVLSLNTYSRGVKQNRDGTFRLGELERPKEVEAQTLYNHLRAFFLQSARKDQDAYQNDATTKRVLDDLQARAERGEKIKTAKPDERLAYLQTWQDRVEALKGWLGNKRLGEETIQQLWDRYSQAAPSPDLPKRHGVKQARRYAA